MFTLCRNKTNPFFFLEFLFLFWFRFVFVSLLFCLFVFLCFVCLQNVHSSVNNILSTNHKTMADSFNSDVVAYFGKQINLTTMPNLHLLRLPIKGNVCIKLVIKTDHWYTCSLIIINEICQDKCDKSTFFFLINLF